MKSTAMVFLLMVTILTGLVLAEETGDGIIRYDETSIVALEGGNSFVEGWNEDQPFANQGTYGASCMGYPYTPGTTYALTRVEFVGGLVAGPAAIEIRAYSGSGHPTGEVLGRGTYYQEAAIGWQGADLDFPVAVVEGMHYFIVHEVVVGGIASLAAFGYGVGIPHYPSWDCVNWGNYFTNSRTMVKFYGPGPVSDSVTAWGEIKALYQ